MTIEKFANIAKKCNARNIFQVNVYMFHFNYSFATQAKILNPKEVTI